MIGSLDSIKQCFQSQQLPFEVIGAEAIHSRFQTTLEDESEYIFPLIVFPFEDLFGDHYYRFTVIPYSVPHEQLPLGDWYIAVGHINHNTPAVKFAFDSEGDLELIYDIAADMLDEKRFGQVLQVLADYAALYYPSLATLRDVLQAENEEDPFGDE